MRHELTKSKIYVDRLGAGTRWRIATSRLCPQFEADDRPGSILRGKHNATTAVSVASIFLDWERAGRTGAA
jgi:hypothetical protein